MDPMYGNIADKLPDMDAIRVSVRSELLLFFPNRIAATLVLVLYPVAVPSKNTIFWPPVEYVHVYIDSVVPERVIVLPDTPLPDKVPPSPQLTLNVPAADIANLKFWPDDKFVVVTLNGYVVEHDFTARFEPYGDVFGALAQIDS